MALDDDLRALTEARAAAEDAAEDAEMAAANRSIAQTTADYYHAMVDAGLPDLLAGQLARDWHARYVLGDE